jgi:hypothetical protein
MKNLWVILSCLISIVLATTASAEWMPVTGDPVSISSLQGEPFPFGDKEISNIDIFGISTGGATTPDASSLYIQGVKDVGTGDYGLRFLISWSAVSNQTINVNLNFEVSILPLPDYDDYFIKDVWLGITGAGATGTGLVSAVENVWDVFPGTPENILASLSCSKQDNDGGAYLVDYAAFTPTKKIYIQSKDISVIGGTNGSAHLSEFFQFYSQIPEPATLILLGTAGIWIFTREKRSV